jgi:cyclic-di-GMP-binding protein
MNALAEKFSSQLARLVSFGKSSDDPLANIKSATRWVDTLPLGDASKCQGVILNELKRFNENSTQYTKDRLAVFMLLDEKSRDLQDTLVRQYLRNARMSRPVESQLWHAVYGLYWEVARGYHTFVLHLARDIGKNQYDELIPLITLRAIRTFGQLLKWRAIRYLPAGEKLWLRLHNLYRIAETGGFHRQFQRSYAEDTSEFSCETAYLHILMLNLANSGSLYPKQIDLLDRWLCDWHRMLQLDNRIDTNIHNFVIDLSSDHGPRRVRKPDADKPMRFWATADLLQKLQQIQIALREGTPPAELGLAEFARTTESLELLNHLQHQWSSLANREQRRTPRVSVKKLADVAQGLSAITNQIKMANAPASVSPYGNGINYNESDDVKVYGFITDRTRDRASQMQMPAGLNSPDVERWVINDESEFGYGAIVESRDKDWLRVGALIGIKSIDTREWQIGIVRRLSRVNDDTSSVGIETLNALPALAMLYDTATPGYTVDGYDNTGTSLPHASLWLSDSTGADSVIIDPVHFMPGKVFQVHGVPERKFIALGSPIEHCEGWMRVTAEPVNG